MDRTGKSITNAERVARLLDTQFTIPGTGIRFGWDAILGLLPVAGDTIALGIGATIVLEGIRRRIPKRVLARMALNLGIDWLVGLIPGLDLIFDVAYRANSRNARLLADAIAVSRADASTREAPPSTP